MTRWKNLLDETLEKKSNLKPSESDTKDPTEGIEMLEE